MGELICATEDPVVWIVRDAFSDEHAFCRYYRRVAGREWCLAMAGIERRYEISGFKNVN
ncbi:hypothetical protein [Zhihengliuella halotolerans]|uniref:hypothetical protein n=1 Tax=Zhihengliuella halotolerans TaxID=370736 RepID=UPI0013EE3FEC|nr:hypothetical protein [Zhihengliuella halotolerans]